MTVVLVKLLNLSKTTKILNQILKNEVQVNIEKNHI